ncbi:MAG: class I SAM-dependent RNA methyltransferase [Firmicutes bacterium]|nr:class I SAM-dependent RNA methyltransferase [[Eubacterium] siraeum]MCM1488772.1 class I SAM-dependent RNA methyltransferase [Bacillota bacterium]
MYKLTAPCLFGLEKTLSFEIKRAGGTNITMKDGRAFFDGDQRVVAKMNITSSVAERVEIVLGEFKADSFDGVFEGAKNAPIEEFAGRNDAFPVAKGHSLNSKITSIPALQRTVKKALVWRMSRKYKLNTLPETGTVYPVRFLLQKDIMLLTLDTTGSSLHKRGYRSMSGEAPIRETLAAGIADIAHLRAGDAVCDPFCGSGTILIEAAMKMLNIAPGLNRSFSASEWGCFDKSVWEQELTAARERIRPADVKLYGFDIDKDAVDLARKNAWKAGVDKYITLERRDIADFSYPEIPCKIITNPPYAQRMLTEEQVTEIYLTMGKKLLPLKDSSLYVITSREDFPELLGKKADKDRKLYNGMLKCRLYSYFGEKRAN